MCVWDAQGPGFYFLSSIKETGGGAGGKGKKKRKENEEEVEKEEGGRGGLSRCGAWKPTLFSTFLCDLQHKCTASLAGRALPCSCGGGGYPETMTTACVGVETSGVSLTKSQGGVIPS